MPIKIQQQDCSCENISSYNHNHYPLGIKRFTYNADDLFQDKNIRRLYIPVKKQTSVNLPAKDLPK